MHHARQEADKKVYENIDPKSSEVYRLANQFRKENTDVVGDKPVKNDAGEMSMRENSKQAWLEHYQRLLNVEFDWDPDHLSYQPPVEGPPIPITINMVKKAILQMKAGKAPGLSGIVVEMIRAAGDMGASMIHELAAAIICDGKVPSDWEQIFIVCLYKGKVDALERGNYRSLQLTEQVMKILERIMDGPIRQLVSIDDSQFGFVPGRGTTDAIFVVRQLQEKYLAAKKRLHMAFVGLEKAFDRVLWKVIWWALRKLGVEDLYADDLVIIAESLEECVRRLLTWKEANEKKGLRVNAGKTKIMICDMGLDLLQSSGEFPCPVCHSGVGSIFCNGCKHWVHKKCSDKRPRLQNVHGARELHAPWMADHRWKSRFDLTSLRW